MINQDWRQFFGYLKNQEPFNRVYFESYYLDNAELKPKPGGIATDCLRYLFEYGASFEKTESVILHKLMNKVDISSRIHRLFDDFIQYGREFYATYRINRTLKPGERGILFYGGDHTQGFVTKLSKLDLILEVYPSKDPFEIVLPRFG